MRDKGRPNINVVVDGVKIKLRPGEERHVFYSWDTDEGWDSYGWRVRYNADTGIVSKEWIRDGVDCDGRITQYDAFEWSGGVWVRRDQGVRDWPAKQAGY